MTDTTLKGSAEIDAELHTLTTQEQELEIESATLLDKLASDFNQKDAQRRSLISQQLDSIKVRKQRLASEHHRAIIREEIEAFLADLAIATPHRAALPLLENQINELEATLLNLRQQYAEHQTIWTHFQKSIIHRTATAQQDPDGLVRLLQIINQHQLETPLMHEVTPQLSGWGRPK